MRGRVRAVGVAALGAVWAASGGPEGSACADARSNNIPPSDLQPEASPWVYPELKKGIEVRREKENRLRRYVARLGPRLLKMRERVASECQNATPEVPESEKVSRHPRSAEGRCKALVSEYEQIVRRVERETAELTWGSVDAQARRLQFTRDYGCSGWTDEALEEIKQHSPIIELGAGNGQWQAALSELGADVIAYDNFSALPLPHWNMLAENDNAKWPKTPHGKHRVAENKPSPSPSPSPSFGSVLHGDERVLSSSSLLDSSGQQQKQEKQKQNRTLLVVYPEGDFLERCLKHYSGEILLFVGEGRGGCNGNASLFDTLERDWEVIKVVPVKPFEGGYEKLWVCKRREREAK